MARLNESTTSAESVEVLKRRFVRQNREIARVNSVQSLRIRSLESEVSHLLSENVSLRERVITLSQEMERFEAARLLQNGVSDIKTKLDNKLMELGGLVADLGALPRKFNQPVTQMTEAAHPRQPSLDLREDMADLEPFPASEEGGRLPVILEDICYPRRTLQSQEIQEIMNSDIDVPHCLDPGEAPISQQEIMDGDSYSTLSKGIANTQELDSPGDNEAPLPPTLETRKKRKVGPSKARESVYDIPRGEPATEEHSELLLKSGAKRKFSGGDDEEFELVPPEKDDFQFSRPSHSPHLMHDEQLLSTRSDQCAIMRQVLLKGSSKGDGRPKRKVLEPKSINITPTEFRATVIHGQDYKPQAVMSDESDKKEVTRSTRPKGEVHCRRTTTNGSSCHKDTDNSRRETDRDGNLQIQSEALEENPTSSAASAAVPRAQDGFETFITFPNTSSRPTRRQRPVVSYAEPNLRVKMRRPTDEFIAAVGGNHNSRRPSSTHAARTISNDEADEDASCKINTGKAQGSNIEDRHPTTLSTTSADDSLRPPANLVPGRKGKTSSATREEIPISHDSVNERIQIDSHWKVEARELNGNLKERPMTDIQTEGELLTGVDSIDKPMNSSRSRCIPKVAPVSSRQSRRHSSNPKSSVREHCPEHEMGVTGTGQEITTKSGVCAENSSGTTVETLAYPRAFMHASEEDFESARGVGMNVRQMRDVPCAATRRRSMML
ncbi:hypothetical protein BDV28DRAFT_143245 [Aspergillus coremiiformis]|uniref:Shugoshin n=1 Tax=Aspergillus coremiiformis TaxID=138285 RepID=A0A5N6YXY8_9EURO|nr:hypothetical protein BDV28DRAFT_143245 [Aspergillus coremiiformis]